MIISVRNFFIVFMFYYAFFILLGEAKHAGLDVRRCNWKILSEIIIILKS